MHSYLILTVTNVYIYIHTYSIYIVFACSVAYIYIYIFIFISYCKCSAWCITYIIIYIYMYCQYCGYIVTWHLWQSMIHAFHETAHSAGPEGISWGAWYLRKWSGNIWEITWTMIILRHILGKILEHALPYINIMGQCLTQGVSDSFDPYQTEESFWSSNPNLPNQIGTEKQNVKHIKHH